MNTIEIIENGMNLEFHPVTQGFSSYVDSAKPFYLYSTQLRVKDGYEMRDRIAEEPLYLIFPNPRYLDSNLAEEINSIEKFKYLVLDAQVEPTDEGDILHLTVGHDGQLDSIRF